MPDYRVIREQPNERASHHRLFVYVRRDGDDRFALAGVLSFKGDEVEEFVGKLRDGSLDLFDLQTLTLPTRPLAMGVRAVPGPPGEATVYDIDDARQPPRLTLIRHINEGGDPREIPKD